MSDDLLEELNNVLKTNIDKNDDKSNKLQSYFGNDIEKDDLFSVLIHDNIISKSFEENSSDYSNRKLPDDHKKSVQFSNFSINDENLVSENKMMMNKPGDAWLNSESTKGILARIISKDMNSNQVNKTLLARPQLYTDPNQRLADPIFSLLLENFNSDTANELRQIPSLDDFKYTANEILFLINCGWIRPAIDLTSKILFKLGFTYSKSNTIENTSSQLTIESGNLWCLRFSLLARMKLISILESELNGFQNLDCPNLFREFYSDTNKGSLIPFSMRLIYAELPLYFNKFCEALNRLYYILAVIKRILININSGYSEDGTSLCSDEQVKQNALIIWERRRTRVLISCMRVLIASKDYPSVINIIHDLISKSTTDIKMSFSKDTLYHLLGKIYLQLGDVDNARFYFDQSLNFLNESQNHIKNNNEIKCKAALQNALINISRNNFDEAKKCLQYCLEMKDNSVLVLNNYAVCCLYLKRVQEAISVLENLLRNGVRHDGVIFNLCILYELQTSQIKSKKIKIVKMLAKFPGDDFNIASFKLSNTE